MLSFLHFKGVELFQVGRLGDFFSFEQKTVFLCQEMQIEKKLSFTVMLQTSYAYTTLLPQCQFDNAVRLPVNIYGLKYS